MEQRLHSARSWSEVECCQTARQEPIHLLGEGRVEVSGTQACLDMGERHSLIERTKSGGENSCGISLPEHNVRQIIAPEIVQCGDEARGQSLKRLTVGHDAKVNMWCDTKAAQRI